MRLFFSTGYTDSYKFINKNHDDSILRNFLTRDALTVERYEILEMLRELLRAEKASEDAIEQVKQRIAAGKA